MTLTKEERDHPIWLKLKAEYEARLAQLRKDNDKDMSETETAKQRGRISEVRRIIDMGAEKPVIEVE